MTQFLCAVPPHSPGEELCPKEVQEPRVPGVGSFFLCKSGECPGSYFPFWVSGDHRGLAVSSFIVTAFVALVFLGVILRQP